MACSAAGSGLSVAHPWPSHVQTVGLPSPACGLPNVFQFDKFWTNIGHGKTLDKVWIPIDNRQWLFQFSALFATHSLTCSHSRVSGIKSWDPNIKTEVQTHYFCSVASYSKESLGEHPVLNNQKSKWFNKQSRKLENCEKTSWKW